MGKGREPEKQTRERDFTVTLCYFLKGAYVQQGGELAEADFQTHMRSRAYERGGCRGLQGSWKDGSQCEGNDMGHSLCKAGLAEGNGVWHANHHLRQEEGTNIQMLFLL